jgi:hypothetical protein
MEEALAALDPSARRPDFSPKVAKDRSITRAFRFPGELERQLITEAAKEKVSVNRLVTRLLEERLVVETVKKRLGWMELPQTLWAGLMNEIEEEERNQIARTRGIELTKEILIDRYGHAAADTFLRFLPELGNYLTSASVEVSVNREDYTILVLHAGPGIGLAKFICAMILASVEYFLHVKAVTELSDVACSIKFRTRLGPYSRLISNRGF